MSTSVYYGQTTFCLDATHRLPLPRGWRRPLEDADAVFYLVPEPNEEEIHFYRKDDFLKYLSILEELRYQGQGLDMIDYIVSMISEVGIDKQYRFSVTPELLELAHLEEKMPVALIGSIGHGRILSEAAWKSVTEPLRASSSNAFSELNKKIREIQLGKFHSNP